MKYLIIESLLVVLVLLIWLTNRYRSVNIKKRVKVRSNSFIFRTGNRLINVSDTLLELVKSYAIKLSAIANISYTEARYIIIVRGTLIVLGLLPLIFLTYKIFSVLFVRVLIYLLAVYSLCFAGLNLISRKVKVITRQLPQAIQAFNDEYSSIRNVKASLSVSYEHMPTEIGLLFQELAANMSNSIDNNEKLIEFGNIFDTPLANAFSEILIMSYEVGDVSKELVYLNMLLNEEALREQTSKSVFTESKITFAMIHVMAALGVIINLVKNPVAYSFYTMSFFGNMIVLLWLVSLIAGIFLLFILEKV